MYAFVGYLSRNESLGPRVYVHLTLLKVAKPFQSGHINLHSHQEYMRVPVALHPSHSVLSVFLVLVIPASVEVFHCGF